MGIAAPDRPRIAESITRRLVAGKKSTRNQCGGLSRRTLCPAPVVRVGVSGRTLGGGTRRVRTALSMRAHGIVVRFPSLRLRGLLVSCLLRPQRGGQHHQDGANEHAAGYRVNR